MARGALLRRNKLNFNYLNFYALAHGHADIRAFTTFTHYRENDNVAVVMNCGMRLFRGSCYGNSKIEFTRTASQFVRFASTNTRPNLADNLDKRKGEDFAANKIVDKGYLDSDHPVEGSSSTKSSHWQEYYNVASKVLHRIWSIISGIGPGLRAVACMTSGDWYYTFLDWQHEFHYYYGIYMVRYEIMFLSAKIILRLLVKISCGKRLLETERRLLTQCTAELFSLVPVSTYNFVRFIEFMLPVFLNPLPSMIFKQEALKRKANGLKARSEFAVFLQDTARALIKLNEKQTADDHDRLQSISRRNRPISNEDIFFIARTVNDKLILDMISIAQLVNMCNCMGIPPCGTDEYLRLMLQKRLKMIQKEDKLINAKGIESLSEADLQKCCRERGIHLGEEMHQQLYSWLDLSLNHHVPCSLLILYRTFATTGKSKPEEAILTTMFSFPYELPLIATARSLPCPDKNRRYTILRLLKTLAKKENIRKKMISEMKRSDTTQGDLALEEMITPITHAATEPAKASSGDNQKKLCESSYANTSFATALPVITECEKFLMLVKKEINLINSVHDIEGEYDKIIAMKADRAAREENEQDAVLCTSDEVSSVVLAKRADAMLQKLDKEIDDVDAETGYRWRGLDRYCDGTVSPEMVAAAALYLKDALGKDGVQKLISNISKHNGVDLVPGSKISRETLITCNCVGIVPYLEGNGCNVLWRGRCVYIKDETSEN